MRQMMSILLLSCLFLARCNALCGAERTPKPGQAARRAYRSGPYCGIACVYAAMELMGQKVPFLDLLRPEYVESSRGSSLNGLKKAVEAHGLHATPVRNADAQLLRHCPYLMVLRVKSHPGEDTYDHYVLFLGTENQRPRVFDPPDHVKSPSFNELVPEWDGHGLIVSSTPVDLAQLFAPARRRLLLYAAISITVVLLAHWAKRRLPLTYANSYGRVAALSVGQSLICGIAALGCAATYHRIHEGGFLANPHARQAVQQAHAGDFIPKIQRTEVRHLMSKGAVLIDARLHTDYQSDHLEGAINVPIDANDVRRREITASLPRNARIVVYCQSRTCKFAEKMAVWLEDNGFLHVVIYRAGWIDWAARNAKNNAEAKS